MNFNNDWQFRKRGEEWKHVNLPHDAMLEEKRDPLCRNGVNTGYFPGGIYEYEKKFLLRGIRDHCQYILQFGQVYQQCRIFVNGINMGENIYGFMPFSINITDALNVGENIIHVDVRNDLEPNCRWYPGSGILRPVYLILHDTNGPVLPQIHTISVYPVCIDVTGDLDSVVRISDGATNLYQGASGKISLSHVQLWSAEQPKLYTCTVEKNGIEKSVEFGIRLIEWNPRQGLLVNGHSVKLRGGCIHSDNGILGACEYADSARRRVRILKECGYNAIRSAHNTISEELLQACDELGMYVLDEAFDGWYIPKTYHDSARVFEQIWRDALRAMAAKDYNHPSVIMYSIGNEVSETAEKEGVQCCVQMRNYMHDLDASRPVTAGINVLLDVFASRGVGVYRQTEDYQPLPLPPMKKGYREKKTGSAFFNAITQKLGGFMFYVSAGRRAEKLVKPIANQLDVLGLNYAASRYDRDVKKYPSRIMLGTETMVSDLPYNWKRVLQYPQVIGDFAWAAWDYLGEACIGDWTYQSYPGLPLTAGSGAIDLTGSPGAENYFQQIIWGIRKDPWIGVRPLNHVRETPNRSAWRFTDAISSWSWDGYEGEKATVEVYGNGVKARLLINGRKSGEQPLKAYRAVFTLPYEPGIITAEILDAKDMIIGRTQLRSGGRKTKMTVCASRHLLQAKRDQLCYLEIELTDENGNLKPWMEPEIYISTKGPVLLKGIGSARSKTDESYLSDHFQAYRGRLLAVIGANTDGPVGGSFLEGGMVQAMVQIHTENESIEDVTLSLSIAN